LDTARVLQCRASLDHAGIQLSSLIAELADLAEQHRDTLMAGRTHSQQALPITFGLKIAGWLAPLLRQRERLAEMRPRLMVVQLGGGVGTLSFLGENGPAVASGLAKELGLGEALLPWHNQRDSLVELGAWLALLAGQLANMAQDVVLLSQSEVGEVYEGSAGGSSTMPHKQNPIQSEWIIGAARHCAALQLSLQSSLVQEHERSASAWPVETLALPQLFTLAGSALAKAVHIIDGLEVDVEQMEANLAAEHFLILAEAFSLALSEHMPRAEAAAFVREASLAARQQGRPLPELIREQIDFELNWETLGDPRQQLGSAQHFIDEVLAAARGQDHS
jgi:3-carboxy-cis,cis-muconate cycloisomerase